MNDWRPIETAPKDGAIPRVDALIAAVREECAGVANSHEEKTEDKDSGVESWEYQVFYEAA